MFSKPNLKLEYPRCAGRPAMKRVCLIRHGHSEHNYSTTKRCSAEGDVRPLVNPIGLNDRPH